MADGQSARNGVNAELLSLYTIDLWQHISQNTRIVKTGVFIKMPSMDDVFIYTGMDIKLLVVEALFVI
jgi:hypothetical protein